jgi:hypothetical protein
VLKEAEAGEGAAEVEEGQVDVGQTFIADSESAEVVEPGEGALDDPAVASELVAGLDSSPSNATADPAPAQVLPTTRIVVALVGVQLVGALPPATAWTRDRLDGLDQVFEDDRVVDVGRREPDRERDALAVDQDVALRARFATIRRIRADLLVGTAPPLAGMLEPSRLARDQSIWSAWPSRSSSARCRRCQTPACCHARKRRQHVTPLPQPSSWGRYSQGSPVRSTNRMPVKTARSGTRGRPPLGLGGSGGSSGAIASHSASLTSGLGMLSPKYHPRTRLKSRI